MVRQAREMFRSGEIGKLRVISKLSTLRGLVDTSN